MDLLSVLRLADSVTSIVASSAILVVSFAAYKRTHVRAFAFLFWASVIAVVMAGELIVYRGSSRDMSPDDVQRFLVLYALGYVATTVLFTDGVIRLILHVQSALRQNGDDSA